MHKDFSDLLSVFNARKVRYLIVGGYAYARYTEPRATKDLDLFFISPDPVNAAAVYAALGEFGADLSDVTGADFRNPTTISQIGVAPLRVGLLFRIDGVDFEEAWSTAELAQLEERIAVQSADREQARCRQTPRSC